VLRIRFRHPRSDAFHTHTGHLWSHIRVLYCTAGGVDFWIFKKIFWIFNFWLNLDWQNNSKTNAEKIFFFILMSFMGLKKEKK
jgi:hypothetical protein